jgi:hypothetical protein
MTCLHILDPLEQLSPWIQLDLMSGLLQLRYNFQNIKGVPYNMKLVLASIIFVMVNSLEVAELDLIRPEKPARLVRTRAWPDLIFLKSQTDLTRDQMILNSIKIYQRSEKTHVNWSDPARLDFFQKWQLTRRRRPTWIQTKPDPPNCHL